MVLITGTVSVMVLVRAMLTVTATVTEMDNTVDKGGVSYVLHCKVKSKK